MSKKLLSVLLAGALAVSTLAGCSSAPAASGSSTGSSAGSEGGTKSDVKISMLNSKGEIQTGLEEIAKQYKEKTGVEIEVVACPTGGSPFETISSRYNSGNPPTMAMLDTTDIITLGAEKALDLSGEKWVADAGKMIYKMDDKVYSFPFCVEGRGLIYNKTAIDKTLGGNFDPSTIKTYDDLKKIVEELKAKGMENPMIVSKENWSLGAHQLQYIYETQDGTTAGCDAYINKLKAGEVKAADSDRFQQFTQTFELLRDNNLNKADPLAASYDEDPINLGEGKAAFWFNGNWAWPNIVAAEAEGNEYGILPYVLGNDKDDFVNNKIQASPSKQVMIDKVKATPEQQQAAKDFLSWLVYDEEGQKALVEKLALVPAFSNNKLQPADPLSISVKSYVDSGNVFEPSIVPGDHWSVLGATMQQYLAGKCTASELGAAVDKYWAERK